MIISERRRKRRKKIMIRCIAVLAVIALIIGLAVFAVHKHRSSGDVPADKGTQQEETQKDKKASSDTLKKREGVIIYLDAGHGGSDSGHTNGDRLEKTDNLNISLATGKKLEKRGFTVKYSRTDDTAVERYTRGDKANEAKATFMVSIHRNTADEGNGAEVWIAAVQPGNSKLLGNNILTELEKTGFANRGVKAGTQDDPSLDYPENSVPDMPSCMVEVGFISDKGDNKLVDKKLDEIAEALAEGIETTYEKIYES